MRLVGRRPARKSPSLHGTELGKRKVAARIERENKDRTDKVKRFEASSAGRHGLGPK